MNGLREIISASAGQIHSIEMPPENATQEEYNAWWARTHCWRVEIRDVQN
jgi:hypothetical protein